MKRLFILSILVFALVGCSEITTETITETTSTIEATTTTEAITEASVSITTEVVITTSEEITEVTTEDLPLSSVFSSIPSDITIEEGFNLDLISSGITVTELYDVDTSNYITIDVLDTSVLNVGEYIITYSVMDEDENVSSQEISLSVIELGSFNYNIMESEIYITGYNNGVDSEPLNLVIPNNLNGLLVTKIWISGFPYGGPNFYDCNIRTVTIGPNINNIWPGIFSYNPVEYYTVSEDNQYLKSVDGVLFSIDGTRLIAYPNGNDDSTYIVPNGVIVIEDRAFFESSLTNVTLPEGLSSIGDEAFCASLTEITIPDSVVDIGYNAFWFNNSFTSVVINGLEARFNYQWEEIGFPIEFMPFVSTAERAYDLGYGIQAYSADPLDFISQDYIIISDNNFNDQGAIKIYKLHDPAYERIITGSNLSASDEFGRNVQIMGDYLVTSCFTYNNDQGAIYVYKLSDPSYERIITGSDSNELDYFYLRYVNFDYIVASADGQNGKTGAVYIYKFSDPTYERKIVGSESMSDNKFGCYMSLYSGNFIIVADLEDATNRIKNLYIYKFDDEEYERIITEEPSEGAGGFGHDYIITDGYLIIQETLIGSNQIKSLYIYNFDDPEYFGRITEEDLDGDVEFGFYAATKKHYLYFYAGSNTQKNEQLYIYYLADLENRRVFNEESFGEGYEICEIDFTHDDYFIISAYMDSSYLGEDYRKTMIGVFKLDDHSYSRFFQSGDYMTGITYNSFIVYEQYLILCGSESAFDSTFYALYNLGNPDEIYLERIISDEGLADVSFNPYNRYDFSFSESYFIVLSKDGDMLYVYDWVDEQYRVDVIFEDIGVDYVNIRGIAFSDSNIYIPGGSEETGWKVVIIENDDPYIATHIDTDLFNNARQIYVYLVYDYIIIKEMIYIPFSTVFYGYVFSNIYEFQE